MKARIALHRNFIHALVLLVFQGSILIALGQGSGIPASVLHTKPKPKVRVGLDVAGDINFLTWPKSVGSNYKPAIGFSTHVWGWFPFKMKLGLQIGIGYALRRNNLIWDNVVFSSDIDAQLGVISYSQVDAHFVSHDLRVPLLLKYYLRSPEQGTFFAAGGILTTTIASETSGEVHFGNGTVEILDATSRVRALNFGLQACVGKVLQFGPSFRLDVEAYGIRYFEKLEPFISRPCVIGLRINYWF